MLLWTGANSWQVAGCMRPSGQKHLNSFRIALYQHSPLLALYSTQSPGTVHSSRNPRRSPCRHPTNGVPTRASPVPPTHRVPGGCHWSCGLHSASRLIPLSGVPGSCAGTRTVDLERACGQLWRAVGAEEELPVGAADSEE